MVQLHNEFLAIDLLHRGAELTRIYHKGYRLEYLWNGDPAYWPKHSPILFPIVGSLKDQSYIYQDRAYSLPRHGFARDQDFEVRMQDDQHALFRLVSNEKTRPVYPFEFILTVEYRIQGQVLEAGYQVENPDYVPLYFSLGAHPAFRVPLRQDLRYRDYYLWFEKPETAGIYPIKQDLLENRPVPFLRGQQKLTLSHDLFYQDALVFKQLASKTLSLRSDRDIHGLEFRFRDFPYFGIWAARNADFVCLEPWCGIADHQDHDQELTHKEGIQRLGPGEVFRRSWSLELY